MLPLNEGELNGLVDGVFDAQRQNDLLQRLKRNEKDAAQLKAWREQNDLIKATFSEVEHEPVPLSLKLTSPPRLRCVTSETDGRPAGEAVPVPVPTSRRWARLSRHGAGGVGIALGCAAIIGAWIVLSAPIRIVTPIAVAAAEEPEGLPARSGSPAIGHPPRGPGVVEPYDAEEPVHELPISTIPSLTGAGFIFTDATTRASEPPTLVFSYLNRAATRLTLSVSRGMQVEPAELALDEHLVAWRRNGRSFVLRGTLDGNRLNTIATFLQSARDGADAGN